MLHKLFSRYFLSDITSLPQPPSSLPSFHVDHLYFSVLQSRNWTTSPQSSVLLGAGVHDLNRNEISIQSAGCATEQKFSISQRKSLCPGIQKRSEQMTRESFQAAAFLLNHDISHTHFSLSPQKFQYLLSSLDPS